MAEVFENNVNEVVENVEAEECTVVAVPAEEAEVTEKTGPSKAAIAAGGLGLIGLGTLAIKFGPKIAGAIKIKASQAKANRLAKKEQKNSQATNESIQQRNEAMLAMTDSEIHDTINMLRREENRRKRELQEEVVET